VGEVVGDEVAVHVGSPGVGVVPPAVGPVGDIPLLELLHDGVVEF